MSILSGLLGGNGSGGDGENDSSNDLLGFVDSALDLNFSNQSYNQEIDDDGSSSTSFDSTDLSTDFELTGFIQNVTDSMSDFDGLSG